VSDSLEFIGDYLGLDAVNKDWYPAWTDMRVGYDQDIYIAIVRPYAPSSPKDFQAVEDLTSHRPDLSWTHNGRTTAGLPLGGFSFHLRRSDGQLDTLLPSTSNSFTELSAKQTQNYTYSLQVLTSDGDTSTTTFARFHPRTAWEARPPEIVSAQTQNGGFFVTIKLPFFNIAGDTVHGLQKVYYIIDGVVADSGTANDGQRGKQVVPFIVQPDGFHKFEIVASTLLPEGDTVLSVHTPAVWLYAGAPLQSYSEDFSTDKNIFTPFAWDTTSANGTLPSRYINDSLPFVNYPANENTWFCLPPVTIADDTKTLEFDHVAAVASGDSAIIEYSADDGVHFQTLGTFDINSYPSQWHTSLTGSTSIHELVSFKDLIGKDAIARYRLSTHSSNGDGWFIGNIKFTATRDVRNVTAISNPNELRVLSNPVTNSRLNADLIIHESGVINISIYDLLGRKRADIVSSRAVAAGEYKIESPMELEPGAYILICTKESGFNNGPLATRFIVAE
jgi:hypothetical protein